MEFIIEMLDSFNMNIMEDMENQDRIELDKKRLFIVL